MFQSFVVVVYEEFFCSFLSVQLNILIVATF